MLTSRLKEARRRKDITQEELAFRVKTTKGTISNYENGHSTPSNEMLAALADVLGVTTDWLLGRSIPHATVVEGDEDVAFIAREFKNLEPHQRDFVKDMIKTMRKGKNK